MFSDVHDCQNLQVWSTLTMRASDFPAVIVPDIRAVGRIFLHSICVWPNEPYDGGLNVARMPSVRITAGYSTTYKPLWGIPAALDVRDVRGPIYSRLGIIVPKYQLVLWPAGSDPELRIEMTDVATLGGDAPARMGVSLVWGII